MLTPMGRRSSTPIPGEGSDGAICKAREIEAAESPDKYFYADQLFNDANWQAHYCSTADDWRQTRGKLTHFVAMLGTSGTFVGTTPGCASSIRNADGRWRTKRGRLP